jgi:transcriptional regulator with XRE-family HTH domain
MSFGARIIEIRKEKGMSQDQLAKALGATPTTVGRYERDEVKPSIEMAVKIAEALDVSLDYLTGRSRNDLKDKKMLERFNEILGLMPEDRNGILYTIDGLIKAAKLKAL